MTAAEQRFHSHLLICLRCSRSPFDLCPSGDALIEAAMRETAWTAPPWFTINPDAHLGAVEP